MPMYVVSQGECINSIAAEHGLFWRTVWDHPENAGLRELRPDPNMLLPGDEVFVPDLREDHHDAPVEDTHRFKRKGVPATLKVRLLNNGEPRQNEKWTAVVDGKLVKGATDGDGNLSFTLDPRLVSVMLELESGVKYELKLAELDPVETVSGVQARLNNLGYESGTVDGIQGPITTGAIQRFQADYPPLEVDGIVGPKTRAKLKEVYGC